MIMRKLVKFESVDVFASLDAILKQNTAFYQSDLKVDKEIIARAVNSSNQDDKTLLWLCRLSGTHCFRERNVFLKDTSAYNTWLFYKDHLPYERILAYAIELTDTEDEKIVGNLYELDYSQHYQHVKDKAQAADKIKLVYERGEQFIPAAQYFDREDDPVLGKFVRFEVQPNNPDSLRFLLDAEECSRRKCPQGDFQAHIAALHRGLIKAEAQRIVKQMKQYDEPNSPHKTQYMVEISDAFQKLASPEDLDALRSLLPYKTLVFSRMGSRNEMYALIDKSEKRAKRIAK